MTKPRFSTSLSSLNQKLSAKPSHRNRIRVPFWQRIRYLFRLLSSHMIGLCMIFGVVAFLLFKVFYWIYNHPIDKVHLSLHWHNEVSESLRNELQSQAEQTLNSLLLSEQALYQLDHQALKQSLLFDWVDSLDLSVKPPFDLEVVLIADELDFWLNQNQFFNQSGKIKLVTDHHRDLFKPLKDEEKITIFSDPQMVSQSLQAYNLLKGVLDKSELSKHQNPSSFLTITAFEFNTIGQANLKLNYSTPPQSESFILLLGALDPLASLNRFLYDFQTVKTAVDKEFKDFHNLMIDARLSTGVAVLKAQKPHHLPQDLSLVQPSSSLSSTRGQSDE